MEYSDEFKTAVREDILNRIDNEDGFAEKFTAARRKLDDDDLFRQAAYEKYAEKPEFKKYLEQKQGFFSKLGDDLGNVGKAWNAGNFYSEGGWNDIAKNIINGGKPEDREALYQNYLKWEEKNQMPESKTLVGKVVNGVANLAPLTVDMLPEAAAVGATVAGVGTAAGTVVPAVGNAIGGAGGFGLGFSGSMVEQSYKVGVADIYTTLRKFGVDDETAKSSALKWGTAYGALEYAGKGIAPVSRKILGGKILKEIIDKTVDRNVRNKLLAGAAKYGIDVLATGTAESAIEGGQAAITETARQGAAGEKTDVGAIARAGWDEAAAAAPAMYGMAAIGGGVERVGGRLRRDMVARKAEAAESANKAEEAVAGSNATGGEAATGRGVSVPDGVPNGGVFLGGNGGFYRNVDGVPAPISDAEAAKILNQINQSDGETNGATNGGLSGRAGDNLNDNLNGLDDKSDGRSVNLGYENAPVVEMPLDKLKLSADVPNFKEGADENGVVSGQRLQGKYERVGTAPIVVWERENGDTEVITGRHRLDLARRSGEKSIPAYVVREADGFTVDDARTFDAESNIRDGMGTVRDYAHFFRNKDIDEAEASGKGLLSREKGKRGWAIGKFAEDNLYWLYRNGGISEERAAAVARGAPNDADVQSAALDSAKGMDATTLEIHTRRLKAFKDEGGGNASGEAVQGDLFGMDDTAMREMVMLSKAAGELVKQNKQRILAVKGVIKRPEIAREMGVDINNPDAVRAAVAALEYENSRLMSPTPEPEIMDKIRRKAGLFDKSENGENVEQNTGVESQEDTGGLFDDGTAEMSFKRAIRRKKWKPTDAEIKEVERQMKEVKAKWTNPDGKRKKGYHCAPNGKESRLTEKQWLAVRTPFFKEWFGDWEKRAYVYAAMDFLENTAPVKELSGGEFQKDGVKLTEKVPAFFKSINNVAHNEELGDVVLDSEGVKDSISHGVGRLKSAAFMAVPDVIEKGFIFNRETNWKERNYNTAVIVAPIKIGTEDYICEVVVKRDAKRAAFYLHEVEIKRTLEDMFKTTTEGAISQASKLILGKHLAEVKENVSQVVDENGEPLVVFHNTPNEFTVFKPSERGRFGRGIYATSNPEDTSYSKKWNMMALFANARKLRNPMEKVPVEFLRKLQKQAEEYLLENPPELFVGKKEAMLDFYFGKNRNEIFQHSFGSLYWNNLRDTLDQANAVLGSNFNIDADGFVIERENGGKWFNFFDRSQVKSATNNVGTYNRENPDIRASFGAKNKASDNGNADNGGNVGGGVSFTSMVEEYNVLRELREKTVGEKPLTFIRPVSAMRSALPKSVRFNKASNRLEGVPSIGDIRRYMERVFNVPIANGLRKEVRQRGALGVYYDRLEAIRTLRGHVNDLDTVAHELGHYLETLFFGGKLGSEEAKNLELAKELEGYCIERFGEFAYKGRERIGEGWAQFISDVIKGDETVADRCPRAFSALNSALRESPRVNEAFGFIRQMAELNANASPLQRVNANIRRRSDVVRKTAVDRLIESGRWFTRMWFDEYEGLERFQKDLERSGVSEEDGSRVINLARNYAGGSVGQVNYSLTVNQIDLDGRIVGKSLRSILRDNLKTAYDKDNIDAYLMCRRVVEYYKTEERRVERAGSRGKFGIDYADAADVVSTATDGMRKCAEELDVYMRNDLKLLLDGGLINERIYATCLANKGYSPLQRYMEAIGDADSGGSGGGFANVAPALRAFKGSDREVISSLDSIAKNSRSFREMALKNRVASRVVGGINRGVGLGNWASPAPDRTQAVKLRTREYAQAILAYKEKTGDEAPSSGHVRERKIEALERELKNDPVLACTIFRDEAKSDKANQIITVWSKGEKVAWQVHDKGLYEALAGMDNTASWFWETWLGQLLGGSARVLRAGATSAFQFTAGNLARDIQAATVFSNNGYVPIASALRHGLIPAAIGSAKRVGEAFGRDTSKWFKQSFLAENAKLYDEWVAGGGAMATFVENGVQTAEEVSVDEMLARKSLAADWFDKFKRAPIKRTAELLATPFEGVSKFSEEVNRLAEFGLSKKNAIKRLRKERGLTEAQAREVWDGAEGATMRRKAANDSKEITLNFSRGGRYGKQVNMVVPFFNAGMQGIFKYATDLNPVDWVRLCVALREANVSEMAASVKGRNAVKLAKVVAISAIAAALKAALYNGLDDDDKRKLDNLPDWRKRTYWVFCIGGVMYQIPKAQELTPFCAVFDKAAKAAYGIEQDAEGDVLPTSWDILSPSIVPQFVKPFIELYTNRNLFTGAELIPQTIRQNRLPSAQELPSTSSTAKWISRLLAERGVEVSPIHLDWAVNTFTSSLGRWVVKNAGDRLAESAGGVPSSPEGMRSLASLTGLDKFIVPEYSASRYVQKFYEGKTEWAQIKGTVKKVSEGRLPARTWTPAQIRRAEWYEGRRDGVAMSREREINLVVKAISEINAAISEAKNSTELTPRQKRAAILDNKKKIDELAEAAYKELIFSEDNYKKWKN